MIVIFIITTVILAVISLDFLVPDITSLSFIIQEYLVSRVLFQILDPDASNEEPRVGGTTNPTHKLSAMGRGRSFLKRATWRSRSSSK